MSYLMELLEPQKHSVHHSSVTEWSFYPSKIIFDDDSFQPHQDEDPVRVETDSTFLLWYLLWCDPTNKGYLTTSLAQC